MLRRSKKVVFKNAPTWLSETPSDIMKYEVRSALIRYLVEKHIDTKDAPRRNITLWRVVNHLKREHERW